MDASPLFPRFEVPLTGRSRFDTDANVADALAAAAQRCLDHADGLIGAASLRAFGVDSALVRFAFVPPSHGPDAGPSPKNTRRAFGPERNL